MSQMYSYDAFISYRHCPLDEAVATRLQELLERYRPPKGACGGNKVRINRIFRDKTELPTSSDLDTALTEALLSSRYLIIVLSEETKNSKWCMEEIRQFKEAHGGKINHILPVLVSGEPDASLPELLRYEGSTEVEPLCCDVRADSTHDSLKKLKVEFLRIAAPLLDCGFDDLYQRHKRRSRQQRMIGLAGITALALTLGAFGLHSYKSQQQYEKTLLNTYITRASQMIISDKAQSLSYYQKALALDPSSQSAKTGVLMLLQQNIWLEHTDTLATKSDNAPTTPDYKEILQSFDLSNIFPAEESSQDLEEWHDFWLDENEDIAVLYNGFSAAVFRLGSQTPYLSAIHTVYGYGLNMVAFEQNSNYYALVYGNDYGIDLYNPGGYVEVYDADGTLCMSTPVDANMTAKGAAFEPNGTRLLVWDHSTLQVWDILTGTPACAPIQLENIKSADWTEDGLISINTGDTQEIYAPMQYLPVTSAPSLESIEHPDVFDTYATSLQFPDGYSLKHDYSSIWLEDADGNSVGTPAEHLVNKMYTHPDSLVAYFWYDNSDTLIRANMSNHHTKLSTESLDTTGLSINDVHMTPNGLVAFTGNDSMLYYPSNATLPAYTMSFGCSGIVHESASLDNGLFAVLLRSTQYSSADSYHYDSLYSLELWDLNTGLCIARPEIEISEKLEQLALTEDGWLLYEKNGSQMSYFVNYEQKLDDALTAQIFEPAENVSPAQIHLQELDDILEAQGKEAWLSAFDQIWKSTQTKELPLSEINTLFRNYIWTGHSLGYTDNLANGFQTYADALLADKGEDWIAAYSFSLLYMQYMLLSDAYDDIMIDYWLTMADIIDAQFDASSEDWYLDIMSAYNDRLYALLLMGYGEDSYYMAMDESLGDYVPQILFDSTLDRLYYLTTGEPEKALTAQERSMKEYYDLYSYDPEQYAYELNNFIMFTLLDFHMMEQRGIISEEYLNTFVKGLSVTVGIQLTDVSAENLSAGLRLGDVILAVNGKPIYNQYHIQELMEKYPTATLTVKRGNETFTTEPIDNWSISGEFHIE